MSEFSRRHETSRKPERRTRRGAALGAEELEDRAVPTLLGQQNRMTEGFLASWSTSA